MFGGARVPPRRPENDCSVHLLPPGEPGRGRFGTWRVHSNVPQRGETAIGSFWKLPSSRKPSGKSRSCTAHWLSKPFPDHELLTPRERVTSAQIVRGASSKEAARELGIGPRTVEFHRENIKRKLGAKNPVDLVRRVLGE